MKRVTASARNEPRRSSESRGRCGFQRLSKTVKAKLLALRRLIFDTARTTRGVGALEETLKWGQPSYLTPETKSGSTIRIDRMKSEPINTRSISIARPIWSRLFASFIRDLKLGGNRSILLKAQDKLPEPELRHCVALALTYHLNKRKAARTK